ncbi:unnamed protein product, partial [Oppiella nova]
MDGNIVRSQLTRQSYSHQSVIELLVESLQKDSNKNCLIDSTSQRKWSRSEVLDSCLNFAYFLVNDCKLTKGDIVCFVANNNDIHGIGILGVLAAGGVYCSLPRHATQFYCKKVLVFNELTKTQLNLNCPTVESAIQSVRLDDTVLPVRTGLDDTATLVMSSGSTGTPKAIIRTNRNLLAIMAITQHPEVCPLTGDDIMLSTGFCHMCGQRSLLSSIGFGAQLAVWGDVHTNEAIMEGIHDLSVTNIFTVPTELNFLIKNNDKYDKKYLKSLRDVFCGGAVLTGNTYRKTMVTPGYLGYSGDFKAEHLTSDGFFKTGDLGYYDSNDYFYFVGRSILISPVELENILVTHESVVNAAVIGVDDSEDGEVPMGFVTVRDGCAVGEQELIDYVNERVNRIKQMRGG